MEMVDGKREYASQTESNAMDQIQKLRIGLTLTAMAISGASALLAMHGIMAGPLDEIGGGFPT